MGHSHTLYLLFLFQDNFILNWNEDKGVDGGMTHGVPIPHNQLGNNLLHSSMTRTLYNNTSSTSSSAINSGNNQFIEQNFSVAFNSVSPANSNYHSPSPANNQDFIIQSNNKNQQNNTMNSDRNIRDSPGFLGSPDMWTASTMDITDDLDMDLLPTLSDTGFHSSNTFTIDDINAYNSIVTSPIPHQDIMSELSHGVHQSNVGGGNSHNQHHGSGSLFDENNMDCLDPHHSSPAAMTAVRPDDVMGFKMPVPEASSSTATSDNGSSSCGNSTSNNAFSFGGIANDSLFSSQSLMSSQQQIQGQQQLLNQQSLSSSQLQQQQQQQQRQHQSQHQMIQQQQLQIERNKLLAEQEKAHKQQLALAQRVQQQPFKQQLQHQQQSIYPQSSNQQKPQSFAEGLVLGGRQISAAGGCIGSATDRFTGYANSGVNVSVNTRGIAGSLGAIDKYSAVVKPEFSTPQLSSSLRSSSDSIPIPSSIKNESTLVGSSLNSAMGSFFSANTKFANIKTENDDILDTGPGASSFSRPSCHPFNNNAVKKEALEVRSPTNSMLAASFPPPFPKHDHFQSSSASKANADFTTQPLFSDFSLGNNEISTNKEEFSDLFFPTEVPLNIFEGEPCDTTLNTPNASMSSNSGFGQLGIASSASNKQSAPLPPLHLTAATLSSQNRMHRHNQRTKLQRSSQQQLRQQQQIQKTPHSILKEMLNCSSPSAPHNTPVQPSYFTSAINGQQLKDILLVNSPTPSVSSPISPQSCASPACGASPVPVDNSPRNLVQMLSTTLDLPGNQQFIPAINCGGSSSGGGVLLEDKSMVQSSSIHSPYSPEYILPSTTSMGNNKQVSSSATSQQSFLSSSAPSKESILDIWGHREPRKHLLSTSSCAEEPFANSE